jgi:hypothetical protein
MDSVTSAIIAPVFENQDSFILKLQVQARHCNISYNTIPFHVVCTIRNTSTKKPKLLDSHEHMDENVLYGCNLFIYLFKLLASL